MRYNFAELFAAVAAEVPARDCIVFRDRRLTYGEVAARANRLANLLLSRGITVHRSRAELQPWESGQDHVALYLHNGNEYLEGMLGAATARAASFNVNYRYVEAELAYLLNDASARVIIYHARFAPILGQVLKSLRESPLLLQIADESGNALLPGALDYEEALASSNPATPPMTFDAEDLYLVYTGGTTGMPKGTLWAQSNIIEAALAAFLPEGVLNAPSFSDGVAAIIAGDRRVLMPLPPLMHAAAQWMAMSAFLTGGTTVFPDVVDRLDPASVWKAIDAEGVQFVNLVGNAFATPMCDEYERGGYDGSTLQFVGVGGAVTSASVKDRILKLLPRAVIGDVAGSSETGSQLSRVSTSQAPATTGVFTPAAGSCVIDENRSRILQPGDPEMGWLARHGPIPLGYLGDRRDSVTINSGGEKIFAEEVEEALAGHAAVKDVIVVGRPSERWGQEVVALIEVHPGAGADDAEFLAYAGERLARYKLPKAIIRIESIFRSPSGKADYGWAREIAAQRLPV